MDFWKADQMREYQSYLRSPSTAIKVYLLMIFANLELV